MYYQPFQAEAFPYYKLYEGVAMKKAKSKLEIVNPDAAGIRLLSKLLEGV
ncbi:hypothetical protein [Wolbachia endosymbiont (group A) of Longitarsus flavicornis]